MNKQLSLKSLVANFNNEAVADQTILANQNPVSQSWLNKRLKKAILSQLQNIQYGQLTFCHGDDKIVFQGKQNLEITAEIKILDEQFFRYLAFGGSVGAGEAYINGYWVTSDLTRVIQFFALNQSVMDTVEGGLANFTQPLKKMFHWLNKNTQEGSKKNIVAHYDLGNEFFESFLDPTMMYSSGIFYHPEETMEQASINKLDRICKRLELSETDHVVEIGTGWGGFACYAAQNYGCKVTTTTISDEQYEYAKQRIVDSGLQDKVTLLKEDYRALKGKFDKLVSIEMIEAVGHHYYPVFFNKCCDLLKPDGQMLLQAITIADQRFDEARKSIDFIKRYIFPGSCIPSVDSISKSITKDTDMRILNLDDFGVDYADTLMKWRQTFFGNIEMIRQQGFSEAFIRMWEFYLCYCEGGFRERAISVVQLQMVKPLARVSAGLARLED